MTPSSNGPSAGFGTPINRTFVNPQQNPAASPSISIFGTAASPATLPAKSKPHGFAFGTDTAVPAMFAAVTDRGAANNGQASGLHEARAPSNAAFAAKGGPELALHEVHLACADCSSVQQYASAHAHAR